MRGDFVTVALQGDFGKPRPALVIQSDLFEGHPTLTVLPVTSQRVDAPLLRVEIHPAAGNGLQKVSHVMIDKALTVKADNIGPAFGRIDPETMLQIERNLAVFLGIAR